uniref:F-box domain-containing protein n=1 Tax=Ditylenchus dipsaci TaxID=166011 RepID=A0A915DVS5_9BILA
MDFMDAVYLFVQLRILKELGPMQKIKIELVCRLWRQLALGNDLWRETESTELEINDNVADTGEFDNLCKILYMVLGRSAPFLLELDLSAPMQSTPDRPAAFWVSYNDGVLIKLSQVFARHANNELPLLARFPKLQHLNLYAVTVPYEFVRDNQECIAKLKSITLKNCKIPGPALILLSNVLKSSTSLNYLDMCNCGDKDNFFNKGAFQNNRNSMNVACAPKSTTFLGINMNNLAAKITENQQAVAKLKAVTTYYYNNNELKRMQIELREAYSQFMKPFANLKVHLDAFNVADSADFCSVVEVIGKRLYFLRVTGNGTEGTINVDDELLRTITKYCINLEYFGVLVPNNFSKAALLLLSGLEKLNVVDILNNTAVDGELIEKIAAHGNLKRFSVTFNANLQLNCVFPLLRQCKSLATINLYRFNVDDIELEEMIQEANTLQTENLNETGKKRRPLQINVQSLPANFVNNHDWIDLQTFSSVRYPDFYVKKIMDHYQYNKSGPIFYHLHVHHYFDLILMAMLQV